MGNGINAVTNTAGVVPISGWNNINNTNAFTTGKIWSSDGTVSATLALTGSGHANGWNSGTTADGGNGSLMQGYCDAQANSPVTVTISGLTGASYTIYLYTQADAARPSNSGDWIPNYTINGTTIYTPTMTPPLNWYVQGGLTLANINTYPTPFAYGNYVMWNNGFTTNGVITISANLDNKSFRSPLNGIELVLNTNSSATGQARPINIMPLGDSITWGYPDADVTGGYRLSLYQLLTNVSFAMNYVGTQVTITPGLPYPNHEGHSGYRIDQINSGLISYVDAIPGPDLILLLIGANDIGQNYELSTVINRLDGLISNITSNCPAAKLIVANLLPQGDTNNNNEINIIFNPYVPGLVAKHAANGEQVYFTDMHSALTTNDLVGGGLHPNPAGYIKMGNQWFNSINALYAPFTGANLALNKSTAASSVQGSNVAFNAVDGNTTSYWSSVSSDPQWISVDLGFIQIINRVRWIWTLAYGKSYQVQISNDNTNWTNVYNTTNGIGGTNSVSFSPAGARYVRIYGTAGGTELGEDGASFVHKVKNRRNAGNHPQGTIAELKSKNDRTARVSRFYKAEIAVIKTLTGQ
jgi:lysophospholipase L1-like esterase